MAPEQVMPQYKNSPRRGLWIALGLSAGTLILLILACAALALVVSDNTGRLGWILGVGERADSWDDASSRVNIELYEPDSLPPGAGDPVISVFRPFEGVEEVRAQYPSGLVVAQSNAESVNNPPRKQPVQVRGFDEAYFETFEQRTLVLRKGPVDNAYGHTWIMLSGASDPDLFRIAESMRPVERRE